MARRRSAHEFEQMFHVKHSGRGGGRTSPRQTEKGAALAAPLRLSEKGKILENGKEGCVRGTQEGFPAPF